MTSEDKKQKIIDYINLCKSKLELYGETDSETYVIYGYILELLGSAEQTCDAEPEQKEFCEREGNWTFSKSKFFRTSCNWDTSTQPNEYVKYCKFCGKEIKLTGDK